MQPAARKPLNLSIDAAAYPRLEERAKITGYRPAQYAQLIFDAAYLTRVQREKGTNPDDAELDRQVVLVFALATAEPEKISEATSIPVDRVKKILMAWQAVGSAPARPEAATPPADSGAPSEKRGRYSADDIERIVSMWAEGAPIAKIAKAVGRNYATVQMWISNHRDVCPRRQ